MDRSSQVASKKASRFQVEVPFPLELPLGSSAVPFREPLDLRSSFEVLG